MKQIIKNKLAIIGFFSIINIQNISALGATNLEQHDTTSALRSSPRLESFDIFEKQPRKKLDPDQVDHKIADPILEFFTEHCNKLHEILIDISKIELKDCDTEGHCGILDCNTGKAVLERVYIDSIFRNCPSIFFDKISELKISGYDVRNSEILLRVLEELREFGNSDDFTNIKSTYYTLANVMFCNDKIPSINTAYDRLNQSLQNQEITKEKSLEMWKILAQELFKALKHIKNPIIKSDDGKMVSALDSNSDEARIERRALDYYWTNLDKLIYDIEEYTKEFNDHTEIIDIKQKILNLLMSIGRHTETNEINWGIFKMNQLCFKNNKEYIIYDFFISNEFLPIYIYIYKKTQG